jgi:hypothetical protein
LRFFSFSGFGQGGIPVVYQKGGIMTTYKIGERVIFKKDQFIRQHRKGTIGTILNRTYNMVGGNGWWLHIDVKGSSWWYSEIDTGFCKFTGYFNEEEI